MYPNIYIEESFTKEFDHYAESLPATNVFSSKELRGKNESLRRIHDLLMSANVYSDFSKEDIENNWTALDGVATRIKDQLIRSTFKSAVYTESGRGLFFNKKHLESSENSDIISFTGDSFEDSIKNSEQTGQIVIGKGFLDRPFYLNHTFPSIDTDSRLYQIEHLSHPCSSLVIIDKYIFKDSKKLDVKLPNLIQVMDWIIPKQLSKRFEVSVITENTNSTMTHSISSKVKKIEDYFGDRISLHVYAPLELKEVEASDRFILTNYALISIPHPFDRPTTISCNFFPSQSEDHSNAGVINNSVIEAYRTWKSKLELAKSIINRTPKNKIGVIQCVWAPQNQNHSIFGSTKGD